MKKLIYCAAALVTALFAGSCQRELLDPAAQGNTVTFTVEIPEVATKGIGDGSDINNLVYAVYKTDKDENEDFTNLQIKDRVYCINPLDPKGDAQGATTYFNGEGKAHVTLELVKNQKYVVLFWAQHDQTWVSGEEFDLTNITYPAHSEKNPRVANSNYYEAFAGVAYVGEVTGSCSKNVELHRPFAQINLATNNPKNYAVNVTQSKVTIEKALPTFNVATMSASGEPTTVVYDYNNNPNADFTGYDHYVAMNYIFANPIRETNTVKVTCTIDTEAHGTGIETVIDNVPVAQNYKTNIVGNLLTSKVDYNVELKRDWDGVEEIKIWDGETITRPEFKDNTWIVKTGAELAWIAQAVNKTLPTTISTEVEYSKDHVISLGDNIRLGGHEWIPIGTKANHFMGIFDGNGYFIEDFAITKHHDNAPDAHYAALFGTVSGKPTIKELTIQKAEIVYPGEGDFYGSGLIGTAYGNVTIKNVTVKDSYISGNNKVAGLLAHDGVVSSLNIDNCHVDNCVIESLNETDGGNVGGLIGLFQGAEKKEGAAAPYGEHIIKNSSVKNCTIKGINSTNTGKRSNGEFVACISGKVNQTLVISGCTIEDNTFTQTFKKNEGEEDYVSPYGDFVGGDRNDDRKGTVIVDGKYMFDNGFTKEGNEIEVSNASHFLKAIAMVEDGDKITLLGDVIFTETNRTHNSGSYFDGLYYIGDKSFTIDLGGKTISQNGEVNDYLLNFKNAGSKANSITLKNGTIDAGATAFCAICTSSTQENELTINTENVNIINNMSNGSTIKLRGGAILNVNDGTIITGKNSYLGIECVASTVNIYDGAEIYMNGTSSYNGCLVGACGGGTVNVYGGYGKGVKGGFIAMTSGGTINVSGGEWIANTNGTIGDNSNLYVLTAQSNKNESGFVGGAYINVTGGTFRGGMDAWVLNNVPEEEAKLNIKGGNFNANPETYLAEGYEAENVNGIYVVSKKPEATVNGTSYGTLAEAVAAANAGETITVIDDVTLTEALTLPAGITFNGNGKAIQGTINVAGNLAIMGDVTISTLKATNGGVISIEEGKTLALNSFSFGSKDAADAEYEIKGGTVTASYGFFQHGTYELYSNFETGYMYYSYGSDITVYGTFHSQGKGDGLDYVRGKLTIANGGKSIHDKSLWVGQPADLGAMNASLVIEEGGYVQANSLSVYEGSSLTYSNDADLKYNSVTGTEYITKK